MKRDYSVEFMIVMFVMFEVGVGKLHRVGDKQGWNPNVNYSEWCSHEQFYVGDWLLFNFDKHYFNVLEVNKTSYETCNDQNFIQNITRGGRDVFELTEARPYYFLSGGGYCFHGMKVVVNVEIPQAPAPAPAKNDSPSIAGSYMFLLIVISMPVACLVLLF
ncbi:Early nodulin-like protein 20 [Theobroma cacao]|uniref:Early nodulin-like protein 20 n=1 Tax=Theobroma cacao TaxID=3641 RepID=A0A061EMK9_THECC|nr:Early nodulin-like protein 20 [Theobroma cacao]